eukprot:c28684_g1_i1 orf=7-366(-)
MPSHCSSSPSSILTLVFHLVFTLASSSCNAHMHAFSKPIGIQKVQNLHWPDFSSSCTCHLNLTDQQLYLVSSRIMVEISCQDTLDWTLDEAPAGTEEKDLEHSVQVPLDSNGAWVPKIA